MSTVAPNTPKTSWIKDNGTTISITTDIFIDESGNFFVDELGNNLLDTVSTYGNALAHSWNKDDDPTTSWSNSFETTAIVYTRTTVSGDIRVTERGDTRVSNNSGANKSLPHDWAIIDKTPNKWSNSFEVTTTTSYRTTKDGNTRVTIQGDIRISNHSDKNQKANTSWSKDEY